MRPSRGVRAAPGQNHCMALSRGKRAAPAQSLHGGEPRSAGCPGPFPCGGSFVGYFLGIIFPLQTWLLVQHPFSTYSHLLLKCMFISNTICFLGGVIFFYRASFLEFLGLSQMHSFISIWGLLILLIFVFEPRESSAQAVWGAVTGHRSCVRQALPCSRRGPGVCVEIRF